MAGPPLDEVPVDGGTLYEHFCGDGWTIVIILNPRKPLLS